MKSDVVPSIVFLHLVELINCGCIFCSAYDESEKRRKLFLIYSNKGKIFVRNAARDAWDEVKEKGECERIREGFNHAIMERKIPCFMADSSIDELAEVIVL